MADKIQSDGRVTAELAVSAVGEGSPGDAGCVTPVATGDVMGDDNAGAADRAELAVGVMGEGSPGDADCVAAVATGDVMGDDAGAADRAELVVGVMGDWCYRLRITRVYRLHDG